MPRFTLSPVRPRPLCFNKVTAVRAKKSVYLGKGMFIHPQILYRLLYRGSGADQRGKVQPCSLPRLSFLLWDHYTKEPPPGSVLCFQKRRVQGVKDYRVRGTRETKIEYALGKSKHRKEARESFHFPYSRNRSILKAQNEQCGFASIPYMRYNKQ